MALYRKYRPASFAEMIGQEQVTRPLSTALDNGRVNHAYLFSGPRGTGKTSSARILARSLNCAEGPTSTPCGVCPSCVSLAPGGPGNLDVTEMDAASNGGVDEMRELRERAYFAPAESRYRVFIIDEAHMITGALAERINSEHNNKDIVAALSEKLGTTIAVRCVVGTDPKAEGFSPAKDEPAAWNPLASPAEAEVAESPQKQEPAPSPVPAETAAAAAAVAAADAAKSTPADRWSRPPRPIGGDELTPAHFSDGAPLPPEPTDPDEPSEAPEPEYTREDEERDMVDQSMEAGELDRRNPTEVAMDLLAEELGARPL